MNLIGFVSLGKMIKFKLDVKHALLSQDQFPMIKGVGYTQSQYFG